MQDQGILHSNSLQELEHNLLQVVCNFLLNLQYTVSMIVFVYQHNQHMHVELLQIVIHACEQAPPYHKFLKSQIQRHL